MNYFLSTESFIDKKVLEVISIALIAEDGREYYALNLDCNLLAADYQTKLDIIEPLPEKKDVSWRTQEQIKSDLLHFIHGHKGHPWYSSEDVEGLKDDPWFDKDVRIWAWSENSNDYKSLQKFFGGEGNLPKWFPEYCNYLEEQWNWFGTSELPEKPQEAVYSALADARWRKIVFEEIRKGIPYKPL
jgi:hypothetical protein